MKNFRSEQPQIGFDTWSKYWERFGNIFIYWIFDPVNATLYKSAQNTKDFW